MAFKSAAYWIEKLKLEKHFLEWGYFKETLRDENMVTTKEGTQRSASTLIYFLHLPSGPLGKYLSILNFHFVSILLITASDTVFCKLPGAEITHFYQGQPIKIYTIDDNKKMEMITLGLDDDLQHIAKPGLWFSRVFDLPPQKDADLAKVPYCLVGVTVAPGFEMDDLQTAKYSELIE